MNERIRQKLLLKWLLIAAGWTLFALFFASEVVISRANLGRPLGFGRALGSWLICALLWLIATPLMLALARRFPFDRSHWLRNAVLHLGISAVLSFFLLGLYLAITSAIELEPGTRTFLQAFRALLVNSFHSEVLTYWVVIGLAHGFNYYRKYREREVRAAQLETRLAQAQLEALRMQLHPHFLFNTLNSISVLMSEDITAARRMLIRLSELLRASLEKVGAQEVSLREELEFLTNYLEIEQTRFQDRLAFRMNVDPHVLNAKVPNLILQPLVENAMRHGAPPAGKPGLIEISAIREDGTVQLKVRDNGRGLGSASPQSLEGGIGLSNTRGRLRQLYGSAHTFEIRNAGGGGFEVLIVLPFRRADSELAITD